MPSDLNLGYGRRKLSRFYLSSCFFDTHGLVLVSALLIIVQRIGEKLLVVQAFLIGSDGGTIRESTFYSASSKATASATFVVVISLITDYGELSLIRPLGGSPASFLFNDDDTRRQYVGSSLFIVTRETVTASHSVGRRICVVMK